MKNKLFLALSSVMALSTSVQADSPSDVDFVAYAHVQDIGQMTSGPDEWVGTTGQRRRLELSVKLVSFPPALVEHRIEARKRPRSRNRGKAHLDNKRRTWLHECADMCCDLASLFVVDTIAATVDEGIVDAVLDVCR